MPMCIYVPLLVNVENALVNVIYALLDLNKLLHGQLICVCVLVEFYFQNLNLNFGGKIDSRCG